MNNKPYTYNDFTYQKQGDEENDGVNIIHDKPYPKKVYKFYPINSFSVDALVNGYFYASHPYELNDFLDSSPFLLFSSKKQPLERYRTLFQNLISEEELIEYFESDNSGKMFIQLYWDLISNIFGIISLSSNDNSLLMWPHYTQEKGFQLTFNSKNIEKSIEEKIGNGECFGIFPINYTTKLNPIDLDSFDSYHVPFFYATNVKIKHWEYESEWRFIIGKQMMGVPNSKVGLNIIPDYATRPQNRFTHYDNHLVEQITLGMNFFTTEHFKLEWLDGQKFKVSPIKSNKNLNYENHKRLLIYIYENLSDKLYHSGTKYENDEDGSTFLIRTKERLNIERVAWDTYVLTRTDDLIKIF